MPYLEFDGPLDGEDKKPASGFVPFDGELDAPAPKRGMLDSVLDTVRGIPDALRRMPDPLRDKRTAEGDKRSVMERLDGQEVTAAPAPAPADTSAPRGLFAELKEQDAAPFIKQRAQQTRDIIDPSAEARTRRLIDQGMNVGQAQHVGKRAAAAGVLPGMEGGTSRMESTDFDFATRKKFNEDPFFKNPVVRGAVKGYEGYKQGVRGVNQFAAEVLGADDLAGTIAGNTEKSRAFTDAMGAPTDHLQRNFEGAVSSVATQLPALIAGAATGSSALTLGSMFVQTFGSEYTDGRARGQDISNATQRAGLMASFEVVGERLGLGQQLDLIRNAARGVETNALAKFLANNIKNEIPGESVTTTGQFLTDKLGDGIGLNTEAGFADYLSQMGDTVTQTIMQGGIMAAGTGGLNAGMRKLQTGDQARNAEAAADAARTDALGKWNTNGLRPSAPAAPAGRTEPTWREAAGTPAAPRATIADIGAATSVDEAIAAAQAMVSTPHATPADIDAMENAALDLPADSQAGQPIADNVALAQPGAAVALPDPGLPGAVPAMDAAPVAAALTPQRDAIDQIINQDEDWHAFPPETGTLGIPRAEMPQIKAEHRGAMTQFLNARGIAHEQVEVDAESLKPTQAEFSLGKVQKAIDYQGGNRSILVSSDGHVLDGHHQWMAAAEKGEPVKAIRLNAPIAQLLDTVREFPSAGVSEGAPQSDSEPPVAKGMTRLYHGGEAGRYDGDAWYSTDRKYAAGYATKDGRTTAEVQYVDYPTDKINAHADPDGYGQTPAKGFHTTIELSSEETGLRKPLNPTTAKDPANVSERPQVRQEAPIEEGAQGAPQAAPSKLDAARAKHQRQDDAVAQAAANIAARKKASGGQRARERVKMANPFLGFLASHGVAIDDRSDTGGEKGRKGGVMVPGYGPLYRRSGKRLDELATLAQEAGFLTTQDIEDATDTGGTRKLADMIQRAVQGKEVIREAGAIDGAMPDADARLMAEAQSLGIDTDGKTGDQLYDEVATVHAAREDRRETIGAASVDEQAQIDRIADELEQLARDADIPLDGIPSSGDLTDEDIDAIFGIQTAGARETGGQAEKTTDAPAPQSAGGTARADESLLSSYTAAEVRAREDAADAAAKAKQAERDKLDAQRKKAQDDADIRARADASADNFQLGQDAMDSLSGQGDIFSAPSTTTETQTEAERESAMIEGDAAPAPPSDDDIDALFDSMLDEVAPEPASLVAEQAKVDSTRKKPASGMGTGIPLAFYKKVTVDRDTWTAGSDVMGTTPMRADQALNAVRTDIDNLTALLKCMRGQ